MFGKKKKKQLDSSVVLRLCYADLRSAAENAADRKLKNRILYAANLIQASPVKSHPQVFVKEQELREMIEMLCRLTCDKNEEAEDLIETVIRTIQERNLLLRAFQK